MLLWKVLIYPGAQEESLEARGNRQSTIPTIYTRGDRLPCTRCIEVHATLTYL